MKGDGFTTESTWDGLIVRPFLLDCRLVRTERNNKQDGLQVFGIEGDGRRCDERRRLDDLHGA